jgi:hypothetical protein
MSSRAVTLFVFVIPLAAACGATVAPSPTHSAALGASITCPKGALYRASNIAPVSEVLRAAQRNLARGTLNSQGTIYRLTPRNAPIDLVEHGLAYENSSMKDFNRATPGALTILRAGMKQCGRRLAEASWVIHYDVPVSVIAGPGVYVFFVKTTSGWRFWGNWCGASQSKAWRRQYCI